MDKEQIEERFEMITPDRVIIAKNALYGVVYYIDKQYLYNAGYRKVKEDEIVVKIVEWDYLLGKKVMQNEQRENTVRVKINLPVCPVCGKPMDETYHGRQYCEECKEKLGENI